MFDSLSFYNHYGNGDLFLSREFVKEIMGVIPARKYFYATGKNHRMFADIPELEPVTILPADEHDLKYPMRSRCRIVDNDVFINTWLGVDSKYVTPANTCCITGYFSNFNLILSQLGFPPLSKSYEEYLPSVDYDYFDTKSVDVFLKGNFGNMVLIDNCETHSCQAENFDTTPIIQRLCDTFKKTIFVVSQPKNIIAPNYITTDKITNTKDGFDLNELSYLSKHIDLLVGRSSGCYIFSMTRENCMNSSKTFLSFTYKQEGAHIVWKEPKMAAKLCWSNATQDEDVYRIICQVMEEKKYV